MMGPKSSPVLGITYWYPLTGSLDDVRVFNRALTNGEVSTVYQSDEAGNCAPSMASVIPAGNIALCEGQETTLTATLPTDVQAEWLRDGNLLTNEHLDSLLVRESGAYQIKTTKRTDRWEHAIGGPENNLNDIQFLGGTTGWIVGDYGTLLKTTNAGIKWDTINLLLEDHLTTVSFINTQIGWIGGENGLLMKSLDGGNTWQKQYIPISGKVTKIQFLNENIGFVLGDGLLFKTNDGGVNWTTLNLPSSFAVRDFIFVNSEVAWMGIGFDIFKTEDGGSSWSFKTSIPKDSFSHTGVQKLYAIGTNNCWAVYLTFSGTWGFQHNWITKTTDGGASWEKSAIIVPSRIPSYSNINPTGLIFVDSMEGYLVGTIYKRVSAGYGVTGGAVFQTKDGGLTWSLIYDNPYYSAPLGISFTTPTVGIVVGAKGLMVRVSFGYTSSQNPSNRTFLPLSSVGGSSKNIFAVGGSPRTTARDDGGTHPDSKAVILTLRPGQPWTKQEDGYGEYGNGYGNTIRQVKFKNDSLGWKVGFRSLYSTIDGGNTWRFLYTGIPPTSVIEKAYFVTDTSGWVLSRDPAYSRTYLGFFPSSSRTWTFRPYHDPDESPYDVTLNDLQFLNDTYGFITTSNGKLITTTNGGTTWDTHLVKYKTNLSRCYFVTESIGWVIGENGLILKTTDGGVSWKEQPCGSTANLYGIYFLSEREGYVVGSEGTLLKTSDGGNSWISIVTNTHSNLNDITFIGRDKGYIACENGMILSFNPQLLPNCTTTSLATNVDISPGTTCNSINSGNWNNVSTWGCGHIPLLCDQVIISPGHTITLDQSVQVQSLEIQQNGHLTIQEGNIEINN